jgi:hypothetical protein
MVNMMVVARYVDRLRVAVWACCIEREHAVWLRLAVSREVSAVSWKSIQTSYIELVLADLDLPVSVMICLISGQVLDMLPASRVRAGIAWLRQCPRKSHVLIRNHFKVSLPASPRFRPHRSVRSPRHQGPENMSQSPFSRRMPVR